MITTLLMVVFGLGQATAQTIDSDINLQSDASIATFVCNSVDELEAIDGMSDEESKEFLLRRQRLRNFISESDRHIERSIVIGDRLDAGHRCAWVHDLTHGFEFCADDNRPEDNIIPPLTQQLCQELRESIANN